MFLRDFLTRKLFEGGNLELDNPQDPTSPYRADEIDLKVHQRNFIVPILDKLLHDINNAFKAQYKTPIWSEQLLASKQFLGGSSLHFFDTKGVTDQQFVAKKPKVGDIDTQCNKELEEEVKAFLTANYHKKIGDTTLLGYSAGNEQFNALFQFENPPMKIQIDFEFGRYSPETNTPDEWFRFSHSSDWADIEAGVKGVFHKYLYRALSGATSKQAYVAKMVGRGKARAIQVSDEPETINTASFAVASKQGGGVSQKYVPYVDPTTNQPMVKNGLPVMQEVPSSERDYEQRLDKQFFTFFGHNPQPEDSKLQWSFTGTLDLINKYIDKARKPRIVEDFLDICFEPGSQMITRDDPQRDAQTKFAAIDLMLEKLGLQTMRPKAIQMAKAYEDEFNEVEAYKKANPNERQPRAALKKMKAAQGLTEAEEQPAVKAQLRKGMPHLRDLKPADFLDLLDEMQAEGGRFKLQNIPLNVKIDGFGGRFGKNAEGKPFMGTSRTEPRYQAGFLKYHQEKGTTDPEILGRAKTFDLLFTEMMNAVALVDGKLGPDFLVDKQVTCEVLFLPFATQTEEGKLKFVGIEYDQLPQGVQLVLVPFRVVTASTGEEIPNESEVVKELTTLGQQGSVMFMSNQLVQQEGLDVTEIINPLDNIEELKSIIAGVTGKRDRASLALRKQVEEKLKPVQIALEKAIDEDPNIIGKDMLGQDYEGIVINSRLGPIKVTSQRQKDIIAQKNAAKAAARAEQPRGNTTKTAVVAIGSFAGHKGHQELWDYTVKKAQELHGDPYLFIGNAEGKDDPIPPAVKVETWHRLYPEYADNISTVIQGGSLMQKMKHELINPLPGKPPRYDNIVIMVGEDRANLPMAGALMKAVNKFQGYEHVKVSLEVTPRGTGMSFTKLRNVLKDPNATAEHQLQVWEQGFDVQRLGVDWIKHLMDITRKGMGIQAPEATVQRSPVAEMRLFNSLIRPIKENAIAHVAKDLENPSGREAQKYANFDAAREKRRARQERDALAARNSRQYSSSRDAANKVKDGVTIREKEGSPEGVPHISKKLLTHIVQQVGTEGAHAIVKSLTWGDGAAAELLQLITRDLKQDIANMQECAGSGVIATKKQAKDPRYSMSLTKDVRPGQIAKNLKAFSLEEVKQRLDPKCWKGKHKEGTKIKGGVRVNNCVPNEGMQEGEADYGADYQDKVKRLGQMAKQGERKTVWDPVKRVYKTVPVKQEVKEFAPDGFNGGDEEPFDPYMAKQAEEDGFTKGVSLADGATTERAMTIQYWHTRYGGMYQQYFAKGFKQGRMNKVNHDNRQYNLNLKLMKDGSIRHGEQGVEEGWKEKVGAAALAGAMATGAGAKTPKVPLHHAIDDATIVYNNNKFIKKQIKKWKPDYMRV